MNHRSTQGIFYLCTPSVTIPVLVSGSTSTSTEHGIWTPMILNQITVPM